MIPTAFISDRRDAWTRTMVRDKPPDTWALRSRLQIGCPAPFPPHHVDDHGINHGQKHDTQSPGLTVTLERSPPTCLGAYTVIGPARPRGEVTPSGTSQAIMSP